MNERAVEYTAGAERVSFLYDRSLSSSTRQLSVVVVVVTASSHDIMRAHRKGTGAGFLFPGHSFYKYRLENQMAAQTDYIQGFILEFQIEHSSSYHKNNFCFFTVRGLTRGGMLSFALLDYRVTNQIYIYVTRKSSSPNLSQSECLIRHCLI